MTLPNDESGEPRPRGIAPTALQLALARGHRWLTTSHLTLKRGCVSVANPFVKNRALQSAALKACRDTDLIPATSHLVTRTIFIVRVEYVLSHDEYFTLLAQSWNWISETCVSHREGIYALVVRLSSIPVEVQGIDLRLVLRIYGQANGTNGSVYR